jgi:hypothetical protein
MQENIRTFWSCVYPVEVRWPAKHSTSVTTQQRGFQQYIWSGHVKNIGLQHISGSGLTTMACGEHPLRALTSSKRIRERKSNLGTVTHTA